MKTSKKRFLNPLLGLALSILSGMIILGTYLAGCDSVENTTYTGSIKGYVYDDSTKLPILDVKVCANEIPDTLYTDLVGMFHFTKIRMPKGEFNYYLKFSKTGYINDTVTVYAKSDTETRIDSVFMKKPLIIK